MLDTFVGSEATLFNFRTSLGDLPTVGPAIDDPRVELVGVIAHAVERPDDHKSVGLSLYDLDLIKRRNDGFGPQWVGSRGEAVAFRVDKVSTTAKIIFVGSCFVGPDFLSLFNMTENTPDRVMIVPTNPNVTTDLFVSAKYAWPAFVRALSQGKSIDQAIVEADNSCVVENPPGTPPDQIRPVCGINAIKWRRIGGANVTHLGR